MLEVEKNASSTQSLAEHSRAQVHPVSEITELTALGYTPELRRNRSMMTLLFQSLAIAAIPYGEGAPFASAIYGGGPLSIFVGWLVRCEPSS